MQVRAPGERPGARWHGVERAPYPPGVSRNDRDRWERAAGLCARGAELLAHEDLDAAEREYLAAIEVVPDSAPAWFDLGLIAKRRRDWERMFECNRRSAPSDYWTEPENPAWWNLGIAATALGRWEEAREAWRAYGIDVPAGDGPFNADFGIAPVRLDPGGAAEVVWCDRMDPCRAMIQNVPLPESGHRWMDIILHDGAPNGERVWDGRSYGVFDELERLVDSGVPTLTATVECARDDDAAALLERCFEAEIGAEDWETSVRILCATCSEGSIDMEADHDHRRLEAHRFGLAGEEETVIATLDAWASGSDGDRAYRDLAVAL